MPVGVIVTTATRSGPVNATVPASGRAFVAGLTERGRTDKAVRVRSMAEFGVEFGGSVSYGAVYDALRTYFEEGGTEAYVARAVGTSASKGTLTLQDKAGTPANTLKIDAISAGTWSTGVTIEAANGTTAGTYKLIVRYPQASGTDVETYDNLTTPADAVAALSVSKYVRASSLGSVTAPPGDQPKVLAATALSAGADDRATVTAPTVLACLDLFTADLGAGVVFIPGYPSSAVAAGLKAHAKANRRLYYTATAVGASVSDATAAAATLLAPDGEYGGLVYPHVRIPVAGSVTKLISPEAYVAAVRARAHLAEGPWQAPAGEVSAARFVLGPERELTRAEVNTLNDGQVIPVRTIAGSTRVYGYRSLSTDADNYALLVGRDVLNTVAVEAENRLEPYVFRTIDGKGQLLSNVAGTLVGLLDPMRAAGGLYERTAEDGSQIDPGYSVDVGDTVNTDAVLNANSIAAVVAMRVSPVGSLISVTIVKAGLTASV